ncbi:MAG: hypothetical protein V4689_12855 [Verrucomicrobiota bacterium]
MHQINGKPVQFQERGLFVSAHYLGNQVGRIKSHDKGDGTVLLGDVEVDERVEIWNGRLARFIRRFHPDRGVVFPRKQRIGTELLKRFMQACERKGVREIFGNVTHEADRSQPFLRGWYEGFGFVVCPPDGRDEWFPIKYKVIWKRREGRLPYFDGSDPL